MYNGGKYKHRLVIIKPVQKFWTGFCGVQFTRVGYKNIVNTDNR